MPLAMGSFAAGHLQAETPRDSPNSLQAQEIIFWSCVFNAKQESAK